MPRKPAKARRSSGAHPVRWAALALLVLGAAGLGGQLAALPSRAEIEALRSTQVRDTALMRERVREAAEKGRKLRPRQQWVELDQVSRAAVTAVLTSEDARFFSHGALDLKELNDALQDSIEEGRKLRGASTLTQQVAKNLWLSNDRSLWRKAKEAWLSWRLEQALPKRRILRLYLNVAEWGEGVFGIEAAAQAHLKKRAADLTLGEGAALAAMLPNPRRFGPQAPAVLRRRAAHVLDRCLEDRVATEAEIATASAELDRWLGPLAPGKPSGDSSSAGAEPGAPVTSPP